MCYLNGCHLHKVTCDVQCDTDRNYAEHGMIFSLRPQAFGSKTTICASMVISYRSLRNCIPLYKVQKVVVPDVHLQMGTLLKIVTLEHLGTNDCYLLANVLYKFSGTRLLHVDLFLQYAQQGEIWRG
jgi:hypothetical protein